MTPKLVDTVRTYLMASPQEMEEANLTPGLRKRMTRLRDFYNYSLEYPRTPTKDLAKMIRDKYGISVPQSYEDVRLIDACIGLINRRTREYDRARVRDWCEEAISLAREKGDVKAFTAAIAVYVKGTNLDKDEASSPDYSAIVPQTFVFCSDPEVAGFKKVPGILEKARKMLKRDIGEAQIVEEYTAGSSSPTAPDSATN